MPKLSTDIELFYNEFADEFDRKMNRYDLQRRLDIVFNELLPHDISGKKLLDAGCGTGYFSKKASEKGALVTSLDIGERLLEKVAEKCETHRVVGSVLDMQFEGNTFDFIISSEVIEHTENPYRAVQEFYRVLKPGGILALTVPNQFWKWSCVIANAFGLRPYEGLENWVGYDQLKREIHLAGFHMIRLRGFHLFPFQVRLLQPLLRNLDAFGAVLGRFYINIAASCRK